MFVSTSSTPTHNVTTDSRKTQLRVGRLTKAHGLKGAIKVELYTDEPEKRFVPGAVFSLQVPDSSPWHGKTIELNELRWYNSHPVGFFQGIEDRNAAETLIKAILWVDHDTAVLPDEPDAWYDHQLTGLTVIRDGAEVGTVGAVEHLPQRYRAVVATQAQQRTASRLAGGGPRRGTGVRRINTAWCLPVPERGVDRAVMGSVAKHTDLVFACRLDRAWSID